MGSVTAGSRTPRCARRSRETSEVRIDGEQSSSRWGKPWAAAPGDHTHSMAGGTPILALDMYEHSYHIDYGAAAAKYVDAFMDNINWANAGRLHEAHAR